MELKVTLETLQPIIFSEMCCRKSAEIDIKIYRN